MIEKIVEWFFGTNNSPAGTSVSFGFLLGFIAALIAHSSSIGRLSWLVSLIESWILPFRLVPSITIFLFFWLTMGGMISMGIYTLIGDL